MKHNWKQLFIPEQFPLRVHDVQYFLSVFLLCTGVNKQLEEKTKCSNLKIHYPIFSLIYFMFNQLRGVIYSTTYYLIDFRHRLQKLLHMWS